MDKVLVVAVREFIETVKTKAFLIGSLLMPMLILALTYGSAWLAKTAEREKLPPRTIGVLDQTGVTFGALAARVREYNEAYPARPFVVENVPPGPDARESLRRRVDRGEIYAFLVIPREALAGQSPCELGRRDAQLSAGEAIERIVNDAIVAVRFAQAEPAIDLARVKQLQQKVGLRTVDARTLEATGEGEDIARFMTPFAFMFLLFMGTLSISQGLLTSLIEEKSSRVIEVLLSAVSPLQLMAGKILGMVAVGVLLLVIWGVAGYASAEYRGMGHLVAPYRVLYLVLYFVPGFLFFAAFLAGVGSVCNTLKEAQGMAFPMTIFTMVPIFLWWRITDSPSSTLSLVLSFFPPTAPFVMILRICADPQTPLWHIVATLGLLWLTVIGMIWLAARVFRIGVLMYGKPPTPRELLHWVRYA